MLLCFLHCQSHLKRESAVESMDERAAAGKDDVEMSSLGYLPRLDFHWIQRTEEMSEKQSFDT